MTDPRAALTTLVAALERHLELASTRRDPDDDAVLDAGESVADALDDYADRLFTATGVELPIGDFDDDDDDDDDSDDDDSDDDDDDDGPTPRREPDVYAGLDDEEIDFDEDRVGR